METLRLRALPQPSLVRAVLAREAAATAGIPADAEVIDCVGRLPRLLEGLARRIDRSDGVWIAYERGWETWLLAGEFVLDLAREHGRPVVRVAVYDGEGRVQDSFNLISRQPAQWTRMAQ